MRDLLHQPEGANEARLEALRLGRHLVSIDSNRGYATGQVLALIGRAVRELGEGNTGVCEALLAEARPLVDRALSLDPHDRTAHDAASAMYSGLYDLWTASGEPARARDALGAAGRHALVMARLDPTRVDTSLRALGLARANIDLLREQGADAELREAVCNMRDAALEASSGFPRARSVPISHRPLPCGGRGG